jgi:hypothetical protein
MDDAERRAIADAEAAELAGQGEATADVQSGEDASGE